MQTIKKMKKEKLGERETEGEEVRASETKRKAKATVKLQEVALLLLLLPVGVWAAVGGVAACSNVST